MKAQLVPLIVLALVLTLPVANAAPPTLSTSDAENITLVSATLNGVLSNVGGFGTGSVSIRQVVHSVCSAGSTCSATFPLRTPAGDTIIFIQEISGGSVRPTDDAGNWWGTTGSPRFHQLPMIGAADGPEIFATWDNTSSILTATSGSVFTNPGSVTLLDLSPSKPIHTTMTQIGPPTNFGVAVNASRGLIVGNVLLLFNAACPNDAVFEGVNIDSFAGPNTPTTECTYTMKNATSGLHVSLVSPAGIRDGNVIQVASSIIKCGFLYGTDPALAGATNVTAANLTVAQTYAQPITGLLSATTYYFQSWCLNTDGFSTGAILSFRTHVVSGGPPPTPPTFCQLNPLAAICLLNTTATAGQRVCNIWLIIFVALLVAAAVWARRSARRGPNPNQEKRQ